MSYFPSRKHSPIAKTRDKHNNSLPVLPDEETKIYQTHDSYGQQLLSSSTKFDPKQNTLSKVLRYSNHRRSKSVSKPNSIQLSSESDGGIRVTMTATEKYYLNIINSQKLEIQKLTHALELKEQELDKTKKENQDLKLTQLSNNMNRVSSESFLVPKNPSFSNKIHRAKLTLFK